MVNFKKLKDFIFCAQKPTPIPERPIIDYISSETSKLRYNAALASYNNAISERKKIHEEISKKIQRILYSLIGLCLFCIVTLYGTPDSQLIRMDGLVKLPVINYDLSFKAFLIIGPIAIIGLFIYLHIHIAQHRIWAINEESRLPILFNFESMCSKLVSWLLFYWLTPVTLTLFAWKSSQPSGISSIFYVTIILIVILIIIQHRRSQKHWLTGIIAIASFLVLYYLHGAMPSRFLNLSNANLSGMDLSEINLNGAYMAGANLEGVNLENAHLENAKLKKANLKGANLENAHLKGTNFKLADLTHAKLKNAHLEGVGPLTCDQLKLAENWQESFRDDKLKNCDQD